MKQSIILLIFTLFTNLTNGQTIRTISYEGSLHYTIASHEFFSSTFTIPDSVPDGKWVIFGGDSIPRLFFNTLDNKIHGDFKEYRNGIFYSQGKYHLDSLWTFRFGPLNDNRFKEGEWTEALLALDSTGRPVGIEAKFRMMENLWYDNGNKKYENREGVELWYHPNGSIRQFISKFEIDKDEIIIEEFFDIYGHRIKIVNTRTTSKIQRKVLIEIPVAKTIIEYNGSFKIKETIEETHYITTIMYGKFGAEISRKKRKK